VEHSHGHDQALGSPLLIYLGDVLPPLKLLFKLSPGGKELWQSSLTGHVRPIPIQSPPHIPPGPTSKICEDRFFYSCIPVQLIPLSAAPQVRPMIYMSS
jgi:hypothetical protein